MAANEHGLTKEDEQVLNAVTEIGAAIYDFVRCIIDEERMGAVDAAKEVAIGILNLTHIDGN